MVVGPPFQPDAPGHCTESVTCRLPRSPELWTVLSRKRTGTVLPLVLVPDPFGQQHGLVVVEVGVADAVVYLYCLERSTFQYLANGQQLLPLLGCLLEGLQHISINQLALKQRPSIVLDSGLAAMARLKIKDAGSLFLWVLKQI